MPNRSFSAINDFKDGLIRKNEIKTKLTELEIDRKQKIPKARSIVEQYFGLSHLHNNGQPARLITRAKNNIDLWFGQVALKRQRGFNILKNRRQQHR